MRRSLCGARRRSPTSPTSRSRRSRCRGSRRRGSARSKTGSTPSSRSVATSTSPSSRGSWARYPYRERFRRHLMVALYRSGRQVDALAAYQAARHVLVEELGHRARPRAPRDRSRDPGAGPRAGAGPARATRRRGRRTRPAGGERRRSRSVRRRVDRRGGMRRSPSRGGGAAPSDRARTERPALVDGRGRRRDPGRAGTRPSRRRRHGARPPPEAGAASPRSAGARTRACCASSPRTQGGTSAASDWSRTSSRPSRAPAVRVWSAPPAAASRRSPRAVSSRHWPTTRSRAAREWPRVLVTPGADPMLELARALAPICHAPSADHVRDQLLDDPESFAGFAARGR